MRGGVKASGFRGRGRGQKTSVGSRREGRRVKDISGVEGLRGVGFGGSGGFRGWVLSTAYVYANDY